MALEKPALCETEAEQVGQEVLALVRPGDGVSRGIQRQARRPLPALPAPSSAPEPHSVIAPGPTLYSVT